MDLVACSGARASAVVVSGGQGTLISHERIKTTFEQGKGGSTRPERKTQLLEAAGS